MIGSFVAPKVDVARVAVARAAGEFRLLASEAIEAGEVIFRIEGELMERPSRFSIQVGEDRHIDVGPGQDLEDVIDRYFWRFLNHSCKPNVMIRGLEVVAVRRIAAWEELAFDYDTTEYAMAEPFACRCGAAGCREVIRGFKYLGEDARERLRPFLAEHLVRRV